MPIYKNTTKLPAGIELYGIVTYNPEVGSTDAKKIHLIQWSDDQNRSIALENITIKQYDEKWINEFPENTIVFSSKIRSSTEDGDLVLENGNIGFTIEYNPYNNGEEYTLFFIVTIKIGDEEPFDIAFAAFVKGGNGQSTGSGDVNITPK
jgi:hypothetical protein